jgi:putative ABC transport system permease protein
LIRLGLQHQFRDWYGSAAVFSLLLGSFLSLALPTLTADTNQAAWEGTIQTSWPTPFDLLIRPTGSRSDVEQTLGLVRPNYVAGLHGGIDIAQLATIRATPGVEVAAPMAILGVVNWPSAIDVNLGYPSSPIAMYRVQTSEVANAGLSRYTVETRYVVVARTGVLRVIGRDISLEVGGKVVRCDYPVSCYAPTVCIVECSRQLPADDPGYHLYVLQPVTLAGVDPVAEAELTQLDRCVMDGRFLSPSDGPTDLKPTIGDDLESLPAMVAGNTFVGEDFQMLVSSARDAGALLHGRSVTDLGQYDAPRTYSSTAATAYRAFLEMMRSPDNGVADPYPIWSVGDVKYTQDGGRLSVLPVAPQPEMLMPTGTLGIGDAPSDVLVPPESRHDWYRAVTSHIDEYVPAPASSYRSKKWDIVGTFDPVCANAATAGGLGPPLNVYSTPIATLANGVRLPPNRSIAGYLNTPPLVLMTLPTAQWLGDPERYDGQKGSQMISVIRVKVSGTRLAGEASQQRLQHVAAEIHARTGLDVDVVKGSSARAEQITLIGGDQAGFTFDELWFKKGVALRFFQAIGAETWLVIGLISGLAFVNLMTGSIVIGRRRAGQLAVLRGFGWSRPRLLGFVVAPLGVLAFVALVLASAVTMIAAARYSARVDRLAWATPLAAVIGIALTSSALAVFIELSRTAAGQLRPGSLSRWRSRSRSGLGLMWRAADAGWARALFLAVAIAGSGLLTGGLVMLSDALLKTFDETALGVLLSTQVSRYQLVAALISTMLSAFVTVLMTVSTSLEMRDQLAILRALGWPRRLLVFAAGIEGLTSAMIGGVAAVILVIVTGFSVQLPQEAVVLGAGVAASVGTATALLSMAAAAVVALARDPFQRIRYAE